MISYLYFIFSDCISNQGNVYMAFDFNFNSIPVVIDPLNSNKTDYFKINTKKPCVLH